MARSRWTQSTHRMVAIALKSEYDKSKTLDGKTAIMNASAELAHQFTLDNPRFDASRFYAVIEGRRSA